MAALVSHPLLRVKKSNRSVTFLTVSRVRVKISSHCLISQPPLKGGCETVRLSHDCLTETNSRTA